MYKSAFILFLYILPTLFISFFPTPAFAGDLQAQVRLGRQATGKATGGIICLTPVTNGTENSVQVIFPTGMTVNPNASNWEVSTDNLPNGAVALPGISTATNVLGQAVTFPSDDLTQGTQYCFNFEGQNTLTTPLSTGTFTGEVRTKNASTVIDSVVYGISIVTNDQINVTATVAASPTDFSSNLKLVSPTNGTFSPDTTLTYTLSYGSLLTYPSDITVEAQWDLGTIKGSLSPTESILDYVVGSATNAYNDTPPVVDSLNRKIDWTIPSFPGNTADTVTFKIQTNRSYTGTLPVTFTVNGRVFGPGTVTPDSTLTSKYSYNVTSTPSSTASTSNPTPTPTTPTSVPTLSQQFKINTIQIRTVSATEAAIFIATNKQSKIQIKYGTHENSLNLVKNIPTFSNTHLVILQNLQNNSRYYFKVTATDTDSNVAASDLYLLDTAISSPPSVTVGSLILTSGYVVLTDPLKGGSTTSNIVLPFNTIYSFKFEASNYQNLKLVSALLRNFDILGLNSSDLSEDLEKITVTEIAPGEYVGQLKSGFSSNTYHLIAQLQDFNGNVIEMPLSILHVVTPFTIVNQKTLQGVEKAKVMLYLYNERLRMFEPIPSLSPIKNPTFSGSNGIVDVVLPNGKYRAQIMALGYSDSTVDFSIGPASTNYPTVKLNPLPFSLTTFAQYIASSAHDIFEQTNSTLDNIRDSFRFFDLAAFLTITFLVVLLTITTSKRLAVPITHLPYFAFYHLVSLFKQPKHTFIIHGRVLTESSDEPVAQALLYVGFKNKKVITHARTNLYGEFFTRIHDSADLLLTAARKGYKSISVSVDKNELSRQITLTLPKVNRPKGLNFESINWYTEYILSALVETVLILSLGMEILFSLEFGIVKALPFILVSFINIVLWAVNARASRTG